MRNIFLLVLTSCVLKYGQAQISITISTDKKIKTVVRQNSTGDKEMNKLIINSSSDNKQNVVIRSQNPSIFSFGKGGKIPLKIGVNTFEFNSIGIVKGYGDNKQHLSLPFELTVIDAKDSVIKKETVAAVEADAKSNTDTEGVKNDSADTTLEKDSLTGIPIYDARHLLNYKVIGKMQFERILNFYIQKNGLSGQDLIDAYSGNLFLIDFIQKAETSFEAETVSGNFGALVGKGLSALGGLNVTNFADGLAKFLVKRFKQELTITFFEKFKDEISKFEELYTLFPETYKVLVVIDKDVYKFSAYLNTLREAFIKDLTNLYTDFKKLTQLEKYKNYFQHENPEAYTIIVSSLYFIDKFSRGTHPGEVLAKFDTADLRFRNASLEYNIRSSVVLLQGFSASLKSLSPDHYWVPADSVKGLLDDPTGRNLYFGLIFQKYGSVSFQIHANKETRRLDTLLAWAKRATDALQDSLSAYKNFIETLSDHAEEVNEYLTELKTKKKEDIDYNDYYKFYNAALDLLEHGLRFIDLPYVELNESLENKIHIQSIKWLSVARNTGDLYIDVRTKNYSSAVLDVSGILDTVFNKTDYVNELNAELADLKNKLEEAKQNSTDSVSKTNQVNNVIAEFSKNQAATLLDLDNQLRSKKINDTVVIKYVRQIVIGNRALDASEKYFNWQSTVLKYGTFAATVAQAQNSDEVEAAIESIALPVGSASIKKKSNWNIALNAYLGGFYGNEYLKETPGPNWAAISGIYAPVGVTFSKGLGKAGSASIFLSAIDIGAFASFRLQDDTTKSLPEVSLKNIFAPGLGVVYGLPWKLPISIGYSWQLGPAIRELNIKNDNIDINSSNGLNYRWQFFIAVDIPLLNFYTKSR